MDGFIKNCVSFDASIFSRMGPGATEINSRSHDYLEIAYILEGSAICQLENEDLIVGERDILFLPANDVHRFDFCGKEEVKMVFIRLFTDNIKEDYINSETAYIFRSPEGIKLINSFKNNQKLYELMYNIFSELKNKRRGYDILVKAYTYEFIVYFLRNNTLDIYEIAIDSNEVKELKPLLKYIEENYNEDISLQKAADMLNFSYHYFSRYFKKATGWNFKEYLEFFRVCQAEKMLKSQDITISQVAYDVGFNNVSSFNRAFKKVNNYSPRDVKKKIKLYRVSM